MSSYEAQDEAGFAAMYHEMANGDLLRLAGEGGLQPVADAALHAELRGRTLSSQHVEAARVEYERAQLQERAGRNPVSFRGSGLKLIGSACRDEEDRRNHIVVATRWIVMGGLPLIPLGSYRIRRRRTEEVIATVPLQWGQVFAGWAKTALVAVAFAAFCVVWEKLARLWRGH